MLSKSLEKDLEVYKLNDDTLANEDDLMQAALYGEHLRLNNLFGRQAS